MRTPASIGSHPIHPMLVTLPIGLWVFSLICDVIGLGAADPAIWFTVAFFTMVGGVIGAVIAAVPGLIDVLYYQGGVPLVKKIALTHMAINLAAVLLYALNIWLRVNGEGSMQLPVALSVIGAGKICVSGWLGGQMVHVYGVGVEKRE